MGPATQGGGIPLPRGSGTSEVERFDLASSTAMPSTAMPAEASRLAGRAARADRGQRDRRRVRRGLRLTLPDFCPRAQKERAPQGALSLEPGFCAVFLHGRYWARTSDPQLVEDACAFAIRCCRSRNRYVTPLGGQRAPRTFAVRRHCCFPRAFRPGILGATDRPARYCADSATCSSAFVGWSDSTGTAAMRRSPAC